MNADIKNAIEDAERLKLWGSVTIQFRHGRPQFIRTEQTKSINAEEREQNEQSYQRR